MAHRETLPNRLAPLSILTGAFVVSITALGVLLMRRDAKAASERLKDALRKVPPWVKEVEVHRQRFVAPLSHGHTLIPGAETCS